MAFDVQRFDDSSVWVAAGLREAAARSATLSASERAQARSLRLESRRRSWLAGRAAAHAAVLELFPDLLRPALDGRLSIRAADDGAPEPWLDDARLPCSVSIGHRGDRVVALAALPPLVVGCDVERIEPRSDAFIRDYLVESERLRVLSAPRRDLAANLVWCGKEAVLKVRRTGLRRDTRSVVVHPEFEEVSASGSPPAPELDEDRGPESGSWRPLSVIDTVDPGPIRAWWCEAGGYVLVRAASS